MTTRTKRLLVLASILLVGCCVIAGWATVNVVAWARDLPNRIVIDGDALGSTFAHFVTESYHVALRDGDTATKLQILDEQFGPMVAENPDASTWIRAEYLTDIAALVDSDDAQVSAAASRLVAVLGADDTSSKTKDGG